MPWPLISDFSRILQNPKVAFRDPGLRDCMIELDQLGQPKARSGNFATVYHGYQRDGTQFAIRVFNRKGDTRRERYQLVSDYISKHPVPCLVGFSYDEKGIRSAGDGKPYPLLTMEWVPGLTLFEWVRDRCREGYQQALAVGADCWLQLTQELAKVGVVHGDLQHGNVMVSDEGYFKLVDYDCLSVPELMGQRNAEIGLEPYQHPGRNSDTTLFPGLDNFSSLVIYVALRALASDPNLWFTYVETPGYDRLLFRPEDFKNQFTSHLYHELMNSTDAQVRDLTHYLFELYRYKLEDVPPIEEVLLWCNSLDQLLAARDWDLAVRLASRMGPNEQVAPELAPLLDEARRRVACREALEKALERGKEDEIQKCYVPELLDDYPVAAASVEQAKVSKHVASVLESLRTAEKFSRWDIVQETWQINQEVLADRRSARPFKRLIKKLMTVKSLETMLKDPAIDDASVVEAWNYLQKRGGHATADPLKETIAQRQTRYKAAEDFRAVLAEAKKQASLKHDRKIVETWNRKLLDDQPQYAELKRQYQEARGRLKRLLDARQLVDECSLESEKQLASTSHVLPGSYDPNLTPRLDQARARVAACRELQESLQAPRSDLRIVAAWRQMRDADAEMLVGDSIRQRVLQAAKRQPLILKILKLKGDLPIERLDQQLLELWDKKLLSRCHDVSDWRKQYTQAESRQQVLQKIEQAIEAIDPHAIEMLRKEPCLRDYPIPESLKQGIQEVGTKLEQARVKRRQLLLTSLLENQRSTFVELFDKEMLSDICKQAPHHEAIVATWIEEEILPLSRIGLSLPEEGGLENHEDGSRQARWTWPRAEISDQCRLVVLPELPAAGTNPDRLDPLHDATLSRADWDTAGQSYLLPYEDEWAGAWVLVWARVDVGFQQFWSEPLQVGQFEAVRRSRWGIFGSGRKENAEGEGGKEE